MIVSQQSASVRVLLAGVTIFAIGRFARHPANDVNDNVEASWRRLFAS